MKKIFEVSFSEFCISIKVSSHFKKDTKKISFNGKTFTVSKDKGILKWSYKDSDQVKEDFIILKGASLLEAQFYYAGCKLPHNKKEIGEWEYHFYPRKSEAKAVWKGLKKLVHLFYDSQLGFWDYHCSCGECLGNPTFGYVKKAEPLYYNPLGYVYETGKDSFNYKGKIYYKVPFEKWNLETWWTKDEYEALKESYAPNLALYSEPEKVLSNFERNWPTFEKFFETNGQVIDGVQKVTKHWHTTLNPELVRCPVCEDLYTLMRVWAPLEYRLKNYWINLKSKLKRFFQSK